MKLTRKQSGVVLLLAGMLALTGCIQLDRTVTIRSDGSGYVEERLLMRTQLADMLAGMGAGSSTGGFSMHDPETLRAQAQDMGSSVSFESAEPLETAWGKGYLARYTFDDVGQLRLNVNPGEKVPSQGSTGPDTTTTEYVVFSLTRGDPLELRIAMPPASQSEEGEDSRGDNSSGDGGGMASGQFEQAKQFYQDMRVVLQIQFEGKIVSTNATHREGNTITLMNIDFNEILQDREMSESLLSQNTDSLAAAQIAMKDFPGVQVELQREIAVQFR